ncbi:Uma2 family endonuclease [Gordonia sp. (in: high G+C Gram-positive bacteria)]|uniref:Uma2 family endonuclease n=1 Tax=Gordonia sp. (in: high G+C Gram-positive bacteria) TaxID=84139 RepID=UPI0039E67FF0
MTEVLGLPRGRALTRADLKAMPDDGHRYELIDGILVVSPSPLTIHQRISGNLYQLLRQCCPSDHEVMYAPLDVVLADDTVIQPDLVVAPIDDYGTAGMAVAPTLAFEILSPSTRAVDLLLKKDRLRRAGCMNYWVVDPEGPSITAWALRDGDYVDAGNAVGRETLSLTDPFEIAVVPAELTRRG